MSLPSRRNRIAESRILFFLIAALPTLLPALDWTSQTGFRSAVVKPGPIGKTGFTRLEPQSTGVDFTNVISFERHSVNQILLNGSGVAAGDVDGDGWCDLFFCGLGGRSVLYRNLGNWKFQHV